MTQTILPAVSAILLNSHGEVLLTLRSQKVRSPGTWCLPGGHLDGGSNWLDALRKEVREEVGLEVVEEKLIGIYSDPSLHLIEDKGVPFQYVSACFLVKNYKGEPKINDECEEFDWFSPDNLPEPMLSSEVPKIQDALQFKGKVFVR